MIKTQQPWPKATEQILQFSKEKDKKIKTHSYIFMKNKALPAPSISKTSTEETKLKINKKAVEEQIICRYYLWNRHNKPKK